MTAETYEDKIAALFDEDIAYSISLTRLVDGESTYSLTVGRVLVGEFPGYNEAAECLREIKSAHRASAARNILRELLVPARDELSRAADIVEHHGDRPQAERMRRHADAIRSALTPSEPRERTPSPTNASGTGDPETNESVKP